MKKPKKIPKTIISIGDLIAKGFPNIEGDLKKADIDKKKEIFFAEIIFSSLKLLIFLSILIFILSFSIKKIMYAFPIIVIVSIFISFLTLMQFSRPKLIAQKKTSAIDTYLLDVVRNIYSQLNAGIKMYDVFVSISKENYGELSKIFEHVVAQIDTGKSEIGVLEELAMTSPSKNFRRVLWQIINAQSQGASVTNVLKEMLLYLSQEQTYQIQEYGSKLQPLIRTYLLFVIIFPSLGITFLAIMLSLAPIEPIFSKGIIISTEVFIWFFQIMYFGVLKSKKPSLL